MRKIVAQGGSDDYRSVFSSAIHTPTPRSRARSEGGQYNSGYYYESDGYESSNSVSSSSSVGVPRGEFTKGFCHIKCLLICCSLQNTMQKCLSQYVKGRTKFFFHFE